jgi:hypothetical protein
MNKKTKKWKYLQIMRIIYLLKSKKIDEEKKKNKKKKCYRASVSGEVLGN